MSEAALVIAKRMCERTNLVAPQRFNRLNAILSLLQPLGRYRTPSAIGSPIGRPYLALSRIHTEVGVLNCLVLNCSL